MVGISSYGTYIPKFRLGKETLGWNSAYERSVANFDEDSVTMGVAAARVCLKGHDTYDIDGLIFATTTSPYAEKQCSAIIATALDLRRDILTSDLTDGLRAGTNALRAAMDSVAAGSAKKILVVVSDSRQGPPRGETERNSGDGSVAMLISNEPTVAQLIGSHSISDNLLDNWRSTGDVFVRSWEDRFATEEGLEKITGETLDGFWEKFSLKPEDISKIAMSAPDARKHTRLSQLLGFEKSQIEDNLFGEMGNTGAAFPIMLLCQSLEDSVKHQKCLLIAYGDGCDVIGFEICGSDNTDYEQSNSLKNHLQSKNILTNYEIFARWRDIWQQDDASRRPSANSPSATAMWREEEKNLRFHGVQCEYCQYIQYPPQQVCVNCRSRGNGTPVPLSQRTGSVFTYSMDYIAGTTDTPLVIAVVDFDGGGRVLCMLTDREIDEIKVGMPVEMSFRKLRVVNGIHNYYWKAIPRRFNTT